MPRESIGQTLTSNIGPLPTWVWVGGGVAAIGGYMLYSKKKKAQQAAQQAAQNQTVSSNLGTVPVSNLTTQSQPMPLQLGDTFVNVPGQKQTVAPAPSTQVGPPNPSAGNLQPASMPPAPEAPVPPPPASGGVTTNG